MKNQSLVSNSSAELFHDDWAEGRASHFARHAAAYARRRRIRRTCVAGVAAILAMTLLLEMARHPAGAKSPAALAAVTPAYEIISDDELLLKLHDRPLLVTQGKTGARKIVVLQN